MQHHNIRHVSPSQDSSVLLVDSRHIHIFTNLTEISSLNSCTHISRLIRLLYILRIHTLTPLHNKPNRTMGVTYLLKIRSGLQVCISYYRMKYEQSLTPYSLIQVSRLFEFSDHDKSLSGKNATLQGIHIKSYNVFST